MAPKRKAKATGEAPNEPISEGVGNKRSRNAANTQQRVVKEGNGVLHDDQTVGSEIFDYYENPVHSSQFAGVVKIFTSSVKPNYAMPWQMKPEVSSTASGFIIPGKKILTNAHAVAYHSSVLIRKHGEAAKYAATVLGIGHDCDLALLTVEKESFWENVKDAAVEFTEEVPDLQSRVSVVGFPLGGDNLSITSGVVSRVDYQEYSHSTASLLALQIDAAINSGNSGGPAFYNGRAAGVAFQALEDAENIGYVIPTPIVKHFLRDIEAHGKPTGFGRIGCMWQSLENAYLREYLLLDNDNRGVLVNKVSKTAKAAEVLRSEDVIYSIEGIPVASDGTIPFRGAERINFGHALSLKFNGQEVGMEIYRKGKKKRVNVTLEEPPRLVLPTLYDRKPSYLVCSGLVFTPLSIPYLKSQWGPEWDMKAPIRLVNAAFVEEMKKPGEQVVVLAHLLAHGDTIGYDAATLVHLPLLDINGTKVTNLEHARDLIDHEINNHTTFVNFRLAANAIVSVPTGEIPTSTAEVLHRHSIPSGLSEDLEKASSRLNIHKRV
eukprot:gb/GECG01014337.1/.p1 GENE.gb/GECG01014337.1/~~gb/GECG01014337.1/.p1  ORF type:complete len:548 (+),score=67.18 gb/GECG01014337.1/:1-1644(+)